MDAFRTVCWFHELRIAEGATSTYQMDVLLERPLGLFGEAQGGRKGAWRGYRDGKHTPRIDLVSSIEKLHPGSSALLNHPAWELLRLDRAVETQLPKLLIQLPPVLHGAVRGDAGPKQRELLRVDGWHVKQMRRVQRQNNLHSLACLLALLRLAVERGKQHQAFTFSRALCQSLLLMGPWLGAHGVALPIVNYVEKFFLSRAAWRGWQYGFGPGGFFEALRYLEEISAALEDAEGVPLNEIQRVDLKLDILAGRFRLPVRPLVAAVPGVNSEAKDRSDLEFLEMIFENSGPGPRSDPTKRRSSRKR